MTLRVGRLFFCLTFFLSAITLHAEQPWTEVRSPHFRVLTNGNPSDARHVAHQFEQMRYVFATEFPSFRLDSGAPLTIFAVRDLNTAKRVERSFRGKNGDQIAGLYLHGWEKQYAVVRLDVTGDFVHNVAYHEYTHSILRLNSQWLPDWLNEGMAEFYAYTKFEQDKIYIGGKTLRDDTLEQTPIPLEKLIYMPDPLNTSDPFQTDMFYAESWAFVHYAIFGPGMDRGMKLNRFFSLIQQGTDETVAFKQVFGDFAPLDIALGQYMRKAAFNAVVLPNPPDIREKDFSTVSLTPAQTKAELAALQLWSHDVQAAKPLVAEALKEDPNLGLAHEVNGFVLYSEGQDKAAQEEFSRAFQLDSHLYLSLFAKTMLSPEATSNAPADQAAVHDALLQVAQINPQFAPAYIQLALLALRRNNLQLAYGQARRAQELEPSRVGYLLLTGKLLLRKGQDAQAAAIAKYAADHWDGPDHNEAVELWKDVPASQRPVGATLTSQAPPKTQTVSGIVKQISCPGSDEKQWKLVLEDAGKELTFHATAPVGFGFSDTIWWGADHLTPCYHMEGMRAIVHYQPAPNASYTGNAVLVELRDDLPPASTQQAAK